VLAIGGGSSIDTAKAMGMLVTNEGSIRDYLFGGTKTVTNKPLPLICIPTTAGSGSEVTASSVITDTQNDIKLSVTHEYLTPLYAVVDPVMHKGMPPIITASTGMDALTHSIEAYVSLNANILSDAYAEKAMVLIGENIRTATFNPENITARSNMALASLMAATAFVNGGLGAVHGIAQAMGGIAHTPHGIANSLLLPYVMEMNLPGNIEKFANIARMLGCKTEGLSTRDQAELAVEAVSQLVIDLKIPRKLTEVKVTKEMFPIIVKGTMEYRLLAVNPVKVREEDVYAILNKAYD
jgi:alcohol dehydrogenase